MIIQIMQALRNAGGSASVQDLSARLGVEPDALVGMLEFLVRKGRVRRETWGATCLVVEQGHVPTACRLCPLRASCRLADAPLGVMYTLTATSQETSIEE